jgi:acetyl CoA:N6-hydroxylysine acetyl transferase
MNPIFPAQFLPNGRQVDMQPEADALTLYVDGEPAVRLQREERAGAGLALRLLRTEAPVEPAVLEAALWYLFEGDPGLRRVELQVGPVLAESLWRAGLAFRPDGAAAVCPRALLRQRPDFWLPRPGPGVFPLCYTVTDGKRHPQRPPVRGGEVYRRSIPDLETVLSLRTVDPERDLDVFHRWMNDPRVARFWELEGSREDHARYLAKVLADAHMHPVFGGFDGQPFGYFEIYWAKEDRIAPYYAVDDYDRGIHMLVGEDRFRGPHRVAAWLPSLVHFLFLDDPRTRNVVAEPRADNAKMIDYLQRTGFHKVKEFDFPHKRAALMVLPREVFFDQFCP